MKNRMLVAIWGLLLFTPELIRAKEEFKDVRQMGDIWVVTIDKSGSMRLGTTPAFIAESVYWELIYGDCLSTANFDQDHFLFLTSGTSFHEKTMWNELKNAGPLDESFIHSTDLELHSFKNKKECARHIRNLLAEKRYPYVLSFVSQIRVFSIVHAVNALKRSGDTASFNSMKILTITDDADANDQWMVDYRNLKKYAKNKLQEVNDTTSKYIYNSITGKGDGYLEEIFIDDDDTWHLYVYQYLSKEQRVPESPMNVFNLKATDDRGLSFTPKTQTIQGDSVCFFHIDSVFVKGGTHIPDTSFSYRHLQRNVFPKALGAYKTTIRGFAQVAYNDPVFGPHYRIVPFIQEKVVPTRSLDRIVKMVLAFLLLCLTGLIIYLLLIRPRMTLFTIYSSSGKKTTIKRGVTSNWKGDYIPIQCYQSRGNDVLGVIIRKHRNIHNETLPPVADNSSEVLIRSHHIPGLSFDAVRHSTADDIEAFYSYHTADYSPLLKSVYEKTVFCKLYRRYATAPRRWMPLIRQTISLLNFFCKQHYCIIRDIKACNRLYMSMDSLLPGKRFTLEHYAIKDSDKADIPNLVTQFALSHYYSIDSPHYNVIICGHTLERAVFWIVLRLNDDLASLDSLRSVESLIRFEQTGGSDAKERYAAFIMHALAQEFPGKRLGFIDTSGISPALKTLSFDIKESTAPGYISLEETTERPRIQQMYSPVKDTEIKESFIKPMKRFQTGLLYLSAVPLRALPDDTLKKRLSNTVVRNVNRQPSLLRLSPHHFEFQDIQANY